MSWKTEVDETYQENGGIINGELIVDKAKDPKTELHKKFEWDDTIAGHQYRVLQAEKLLRIYVTVIETPVQELKLNVEEEPARVRKYHSLTTDRALGRGYRSIDDIMQNEDLYMTLLEDAKNEIIKLRKKYVNLTLIQPIFAHAISAIETEQATRISSGEAQRRED